MTSIEEEISHLIYFLNHPAGFNVDMAGLLCIRPIDECSPPIHWEVDWEEVIDNIRCSNAREFTNLNDAAKFFVEKRHYMCLGLDFDAIAMSKGDE